jgi:hypothetical protein
MFILYSQKDLEMQACVKYVTFKTCDYQLLTSPGGIVPDRYLDKPPLDEPYLEFTTDDLWRFVREEKRSLILFRLKFDKTNFIITAVHLLEGEERLQLLLDSKFSVSFVLNAQILFQDDSSNLPTLPME